MRKMKLFNRTISAIMAIVFAMLMLLNGWSCFNAYAVDYNFCFPVNNGVKIAFYQGYTNAYMNGKVNHGGIDIHASKDDNIYAAYSGVVEATANSCTHTDWYKTHGDEDCGHYNTFGNYIRIKGDNGIYFYYGHLKQNSLKVKKGDRVQKGQAIATMGSSGASTGKHLHFEIRKTTASSSRLNANPKGTLNGLVTYANGPYNDPYVPYDAVTNGNYYFKNVSTGTYINVDGAKVANGQNLSVATKKDANAFKFGVSGSAATSYTFTTLLNTGYVVNPYSDNPVNGTNVTLYKKTGDGSQQFRFKKVANNTYIIHSAYDYNLVLGVNGTNVQLQTRTANNAQKWVLESADTTTVTVKFHRNLNSNDTNTVSETFTAGVANQKFGYKTDGTGRYKTMNAADVGFGEWTNPGYKLLGWSKDKNAAASSWDTYNSVVDSWIKSNAPSVDLYAVWQKVDSTVVTFHRNLNSNDTVTLQETFTSGVANQKFGYNTDGIGRYKTMNAADVGFGEWSNPGYKLLGWSKYKTASVSNFGTYNDVTDTWIKNNESAVDLFAIWEKERPLGDLDNDKDITISDLIILKKYLVRIEKLDSTDYCDMNNDGKINVFDFIILKRKLIK